MSERPRVAITMGDPAGIGPELCLRLLAEPAVLAECIPVVFGDASVLETVAGRIGIARPAHVAALAKWKSCPDATAPTVVDCAALGGRAVRPGAVDPACGAAAYAYIEASIAAAIAGQVAAVATAPLHKEALRGAGVPHPGHTEIFTALTGARRTCMMLASDEISVSMVTLHVAYHQVPALLSVERILDVIELTHEAVARLRHRPS